MSFQQRRVGTSAKSESTRMQCRRRQVLRFEILESRRLLAATGENPYQPFDVNFDTFVTPRDALQVINQLAIDSTGSLSNLRDSFYPNTNGDDLISPRDALFVINGLATGTPIVGARLTNDSGPGGEANFDLLTNDPGLLVGISADAAGLEIRLDGVDDDPFVDVSSQLSNRQADLSVEDLESLFGVLADGPRQVDARVPGESTSTSFTFELDRTAPTAELAASSGVIAEQTDRLEVSFSESISETGVSPSAFQVRISEGPRAGELIAVSSVDVLPNNVFELTLAETLVDGGYELEFNGGLDDSAGNPLATTGLAFSVQTVNTLGLEEVGPQDGEEMVALNRPAVIRFDAPVSEQSVTPDAFYAIANGQRRDASIFVSSTGRFAKLNFESPLPASTEVRVVVDGDLIQTESGVRLDADGDGSEGGQMTVDFTTVPTTRIPGTIVRGRVIASETDANGNDVPLEGVTIRIDSLPGVAFQTDADGFFELVDVPAPDFFVHIDGTTVTSVGGEAPSEDGFYPNVGKRFHSIPGEVLVKPFDIYLPLVPDDAINDLNPDQPTTVKLPDAQVTDHPELAMVELTVPPGSLKLPDGSDGTTVGISVVNPDRLPAPLPPGADHDFDITIQAPPGAFFDTPAPISFPNTRNLEPGAKAQLISFDHAIAEWVTAGTMTVSADGQRIVFRPRDWNP